MNTGRKILSETPTETREMLTNHTAELMQRTVPLIWYSPEWKIPEAQNEIETDNEEVFVILAYGEETEFGVYDLIEEDFFDQYGLRIENLDFWAYMPKHPNK